MSILEKLFRMDDRAVVINGGAGRIGSQMCLAIADAGGKVAVLDIDGQRATDIAEMVRKQTGGTATVNYAEADQSVLAKRIEQDGEIINKFVPHVPSSGNVLDIGAGWGTLLKFFANQGYQTTGLELSLPTSTFAREQLGLDIYNLPVERLNELPNQKFDLITMRHVLEHFYQPSEVLQNVRSRMNQDAKLIIEVPDYGSYDRKAFGKAWPAFGPYHLWYFTRKNLKQLMDDCGFEILHFHTFMSETVFSGKSPFSRIARKIAIRLGGRHIFSGRSIGLIARKK